MGDLYTNLHLVLRWVHVLAGILWVGLAFFSALVLAPARAKLTASEARAVYTHLVARVNLWQRAGSALALVFGLALFVQLYMYTPASGAEPSRFGPSASMIDAHGLTDRAAWIHLGMTAGFAMFLVAWLVVLPAQRRVVEAHAKATLPEAADLRRAALGTKAVLYLAAPMLVGMIAPAHYGTFTPLAAIVATLVGVAVVAHFFMIGKRVTPASEQRESPKPHEARDAS
jgi:uncharacterized membrane protein